MKERPIIFSAPMVRAILNGRKTQTRRVVQLTDSGRVKEPGSPRNWHLDDPEAVLACPYGVPGNRLWVRERWQLVDPLEVAEERRGSRAPFTGCQGPRAIPWVAAYRADGDLSHPANGAPIVWRSPVHMPRWASRITLEIVSVRVERLQEISAKDVLAEGALEFDGPTTFIHDGSQAIYFPSMGYAQIAFCDLWDSINAKRAPWGSNPWVWVIEFRRIDA